jgi:hypothetical protein
VSALEKLESGAFFDRVKVIIVTLLTYRNSKEWLHGKMSFQTYPYLHFQKL